MGVSCGMDRKRRRGRRRRRRKESFHYLTLVGVYNVKSEFVNFGRVPVRYHYRAFKNEEG
jgi:hypothetical protein